MSTNCARVLRTAAAAMGSTPARIQVIEPTELGQAIHELVGQEIDLHEFARRFLISRVYTLSPVLPGLFVMSRPGRAPIVPVWSTTRALRRVMVNYDWVARTGEDLVVYLPAGVEVLIDAGMPCPVTVPSSVLLGTLAASSDSSPGPASMSSSDSSPPWSARAAAASGH